MSTVFRLLLCMACCVRGGGHGLLKCELPALLPTLCTLPPFWLPQVIAVVGMRSEP